MSNIIQFPSKICSDYFKVTSYSKPSHSYQEQNIPASKKREILLSLGWSVYDGETVVAYSHPDVSNNDTFFLDDAWNAQLNSELARMAFFS
jgi:hypothetical protein